MAEGTRFTAEKHEASKTFAEEKGLPILKHHLTPRIKGFTTSLPYLHGKFGGIYDVQLSFKEYVDNRTKFSIILHFTVNFPVENKCLLFKLSCPSLAFTCTL
jgi:hypothetical protein